MADLPKIPPIAWDEKQLQFFERKHEVEIRNLAPGLEIDEVCEFYGISNIADLPDYDRWFLEITFSRGRIIAKQNAASHLITAMSGKDSVTAALAYLTRFGNDTWKADTGTGSKVPKGLRIILEE